MREIKFRAWDMYAKKWIEHFNVDLLNIPKFETCVLMQYTGLKDKNGVKIFEGDIIRDKSGRLYKVFWHGSFAGFCYEFKNELNKKDFKLLHLAYFNIEVIGNIYENPELLGDDE